MKWIPLSERKPKDADADERGMVLWRWECGECATNQWYAHKSVSATHWARLRDIELPPPAPVMPERLEYVKASPGEVGSMRDIAIRNRDECTICGAGYWTSEHTLYRRVEPGKRIVFEVVGEKAPKGGEWFVTYAGFPWKCTIDWPDTAPRTILRCVEGEEYLK